MSRVRECNFPPESANNPGLTQATDLIAEASTMFLNIDELAKVSPPLARMITGHIARELAKRTEGKA
jgi:hypothetical protein